MPEPDERYTVQVRYVVTLHDDLKYFEDFPTAIYHPKCVPLIVYHNLR